MAAAFNPAETFFASPHFHFVSCATPTASARRIATWFVTAPVSPAETVLVTGATGNVGRALVPMLARGGVRVIAASRGGPPLRESADGANVRRLDLRDPASVGAALEGVDRLFLATPLEKDMAGVANRVVEQAHDAGVRQIVRLSALGAGGGAATRLAAVHEETETALRACGRPFVCLRPNAFMQNVVGQFADTIRRTSRFAAPQGDGRVSTIDARDVAAVAAHVLTQSPPPTGCFDLTGPAALSNHDIAAVLSRLLGREIRYVDADPRETRAALHAQGVTAWLADIIMELYDLSARGDAALITTDVEQLLGRAPTSFETFAADHADAFR